MNFSDTIAKAVLSTSSDAIIAADKEGIIRFWNPGAERLFGYAEGSAIGQSLDIIIPERLRKRHWKGYHRVIKSGKSRYGQGEVLAVPGIKKDGNAISIEFTIVPLRDEGGRLAGLAAILRDVTKRFQEMRALKQDLARVAESRHCREHDRFNGARNRAVSERSPAELGTHTKERLVALGQMTGGIAHDFRNVLAAIESGLILAEKNSNCEEARVYIAAARQGIDRGVNLTSRLLAFAKGQELKAQAANLNELLKNLELFLKYSVGPKNHIILELASDIPQCLVDRSGFDAALLNLVVNARDAMPEGGEVRISTAADAGTSNSPVPGGYVRVRVKDSGQGIPAETIPRVFDPFFTTKGDKGSGWGLPRVYKFMHRIGGHVRVSSEPGSGTTLDLLFASIELGFLTPKLGALNANTTNKFQR